MEEYTQITLDEWMQWKEDIRRKLAETADNFVHIGYRLRQIRDSGMYDGAVDIFDFALREYGLGKSTVSRFIAINEKYSEGGYSLELRAEFRGFSSSKLSEMLTLPDAELELITEKTTIKEIRELKEFDRQQPQEEVRTEEQKTEEEAVTAAGEEAEQRELTPLDKCIVDFFSTREETLNGTLEILREDEPDYKAAMERMNPAGQGSHKKGLIFLFLYDWITGVKYKKLSEAEPVSMSWIEFLTRVVWIFGGCTGENPWKEYYGESEEPVATSQQEAPEKAAEKVEKEAGEPAAAAEKKPEEKPEKPEEKTEEEQLPGQTSIEKDFPEYLPGQKETAEGQEQAGEAEEPAAAVEVQQEKPENGIDTRCEGLLGFLKSNVQIWTRINGNVVMLSHKFEALSPRNAKNDEVMEKYLRELYEDAIGIAADLERLMNYRNGGDE